MYDVCTAGVLHETVIFISARLVAHRRNSEMVRRNLSGKITVGSVLNLEVYYAVHYIDFAKHHSIAVANRKSRFCFNTDIAVQCVLQLIFFEAGIRRRPVSSYKAGYWDLKNKSASKTFFCVSELKKKSRISLVTQQKGDKYHQANCAGRNKRLV